MPRCLTEMACTAKCTTRKPLHDGDRKMHLTPYVGKRDPNLLALVQHTQDDDGETQIVSTNFSLLNLWDLRPQGQVCQTGRGQMPTTP